MTRKTSLNASDTISTTKFRRSQSQRIFENVLAPFKPGAGPPDKEQLKSYWKQIFVAETESKNKYVYCLEGNHHISYRATGRFSCEAALTLALTDAEKLPGGKNFGGVLTPSSGLGNAFLDRLINEKGNTDHLIKFSGPLNITTSS